MKPGTFSPRSFFLLAALLVFCNRLLLPFGLQYSLLLTPLWVYFLVREGGLRWLLLCILPFAVWNLYHLLHVVSPLANILSFVLLCSTLAFAWSVYYQLKKRDDWHTLFRFLAGLNVFLLLVSLAVYPFESLRPYCWYLIDFTPNHRPIPRLKVFELEASHYSMAIAPLFLYFLWSILRQFNWRDVFLLISLGLSLLLSFSFGVLACLVVTFLMLFVSRITKIYRSRKLKWFFISGTILGLLICLGLVVLFPENALYFRLQNVLSGVDTSGRGRTYEAFILAHKILTQQHAELWGIGLGQLKLVGRSIIIQYYHYTAMPAVVRLPNCTAEFLCYYGFVGFAARLAVQLFCFFRFQVYRNLFRMSLFIFIFIYQFTGSFIFNPAEYIIWGMAFLPSFSKLDFKSFTCYQVPEGRDKD